MLKKKFFFQSKKEENDRPHWKIFIEYLKDFFNENQDNSFTSIDSLNSSGTKAGMWTCSVENVNNRGTKEENRKNVAKALRSISKAIPGGRYGCA